MKTYSSIFLENIDRNNLDGKEQYYYDHGYLIIHDVGEYGTKTYALTQVTKNKVEGLPSLILSKIAQNTDKQVLLDAIEWLMSDPKDQ